MGCHHQLIALEKWVNINIEIEIEGVASVLEQIEVRLLKKGIFLD